ncbi:MAG: YbhB/YbcL family Raf kinase inhibitor-like protein, partial [Candidatus Hydrogenedentales bacterium]
MPRFSPRSVGIACAMLALAGCAPANNEVEAVAQDAAAPATEAGEASAQEVPDLIVTSEALQAGQPVPVEFTGDGTDVSPPLAWTGAPEGAKTFALVCDDPDAPTPKPWVHWVIYSIPAVVSELPAGIAKQATLTQPEKLQGVKQGKNGWGQVGYRGPAPPPGKPHRYYFTVYALDEALVLGPELTKDELLAAIDGHIMAEGQLMATYQRR